MAFIRRRGGSYQLIESYRENGKVKHRVLANLNGSPTVTDAWVKAKAEYEKWQARVDEYAAYVAKAATPPLPWSDMRPTYERYRDRAAADMALFERLLAERSVK